MFAALSGCSDAPDNGGETSSSATDTDTDTSGPLTDGTTGEPTGTSTSAPTEDSGSDEAEESGSSDATGSSGSGSGSEDSGSDSGSDTDTDTDTGTTGSEVEPGFDIIEISRATDLTPDGSIALVEDASSPTLDAYFYDTMTGEMELATSIGDPAFNFSTGVSADLRISALHDQPVEAGVWSEADGWLDLGTVYPTSCDDIAGTWDISADGSVAVGLVWNGCTAAAFRWVDDGGAGTMTALDVLGEPFEGGQPIPSNRATVVSNDGMVAAGFAQNGAIDRAAAIWNADGSGFLLDAIEEWPSEVLSISADGEMVAGTRGYDGFYWTEAEGMTSLGKLPEAESVTTTYPNAIAADGELVFGAFGDPWWTVPTAFVWTRNDGMRSLHELVEANGLDVPEGVVLTNVMAASTDGSVLLGNAYDAEGYTVSFVLKLAPSAYGL